MSAENFDIENYDLGNYGQGMQMDIEQNPNKFDT